MNFLKLFSALFIMQFSLVAFAQKEITKNGRVYVDHTVLSKETLYGISKKYNVIQDTIVKYNPAAVKGLKTGEVLQFPIRFAEIKKTTPVGKNTETIPHLVQAGETLYGLSKKYDVKAEDIIAANPSIANGLKSNEIVYIPVARKDTKWNAEAVNKKDDFISKEANTTQYEAVKVSDKERCRNMVPSATAINIALLLPFNVTNALNSKVSVEFYNGLMIALDTLVGKGANIKLYTFDTNGDKSVDEVLQKPIMKSMNLIIGPLYASKMNEAIRFANENKIPLITPFVKNDELVQNSPYVIKLANSDRNIADKTIQYFKSNYPNANFIVLKQRKGADSLMAQEYIAALNNQSVKYKFLNRTVSEVVAALSESEKNVIIFSSAQELSVRDFITQFNKALKKQSVSVVGTEEWLKFSNIEPDYYENLNLHVPVVNYFSGIDSLNVAFASTYKNKYKAFASNYAYKGYQIGDYFVRSLWKYNNEFCACIANYKAEGSGRDWFRMVQKDAKSGFYNDKIQLYIFNNYEYAVKLY